MNIQEGVMLHIISTKKFKDIGVSIRFQNTLDKKNAATRSVLAHMLCDRCAKYDTKQKMSSHMDILYGASLHAQTMGYGNAQSIEVKMRVMNPHYDTDAFKLMEDAFAFLHEILYKPLLTQEIMEEAKLMILAKIERNEDDPAQYAISEGLKQAGEGTPLALSSLGDKQEVEQLTLEAIQQAYDDMIKKDLVDIILCGDVEEQAMKTIITNKLPLSPRYNKIETYYTVSNDLHDAHMESYKNISQTSIMMVWFTNTSIIDKDYYPLRVANAIFGQYSTSLLFQEVREKHSLCYSIFSNLISYDGALGVTTGVEKEQIEKTCDLILQQFDRVVKGDFADELIDVSKQMIINSLKASKDNMNSLIALQYQNDLLHRLDTTEDIIEKIESVDRDAILRAIKKCELKMTYIVTQGGEDHA